MRALARLRVELSDDMVDFSPHADRAGPFREEPLAVEVLRVAGAQDSSMVVDGALNLKLEREGATY